MSQATHWKTREEIRSAKQMQNFKNIRGRIKNILKKISKMFNALKIPEVQKKVQSQQVASGEELQNFRHELSQSLVEGAHYQTLYNTSRSGASENSSDFLHLRQERDSLTTLRTALVSKRERERESNRK